MNLNLNCSLIKHLLKEGYKLIDIREVHEYRSERLADAINVPMSSLTRENLSTMIPEKSIIYCRSGSRTASLMGAIKSLGGDVSNIIDAGGLFRYGECVE